MYTIKIRIAWWLKWYLYGVITMSKITGLTPDWKKVGRWVVRSVKSEVI